MNQDIQLDHLPPVTEYAPTILTTEPVEPRVADSRDETRMNTPAGEGDHLLEAKKEDLFDRMRRIFFESDLRLPA